ncbi:MAG: hypothetical protein ACOH13_14540 [Flavobacteriales bacterium]
MKRRELRKAAAAKIALGYSRQHAYDALRVEEPTADNEDLADAVRYTPSLMAREHFKSERNILIALVVALALFYFWQIASLIHDQSSLRRLISLGFPLSLLALGISSTGSWGRTYSFIMFIALYGGFQWWSKNDTLKFTDPLTIIWLSLTSAVIALSWYLRRELTSDYTMQQDPREGMHKRAVFPPEPGALG